MKSKFELLFPVLSLAMWCLVAGAQQGEVTPAAANSPASGSVSSPPPELGGPPRMTRSGRLPRYFAAVVDQTQREAIYRIQAGYRERIDALQRQLEELRQAELLEVEKVLSDAQRQQVLAMREQARQQAMSRSSLPQPAVADPVDKDIDAATGN